MKKKLNFQFPTFVIKWVDHLKRMIQRSREKSRRFNKNYPLVIQRIQLLFLYFFGFCSFFYTASASLASTSENVEIIPRFLQEMTQNPVTHFFFAPQRSFFFYLLTTEYMVLNPIVNFSKFFKYNVLYILLLQMIQNLALLYLDLFFNPAVDMNDTSNDTELLFICSLSIFSYFFAVICTAFIMAMKNKFVQFPGLEFLTDSVCFWLKIKSPGLKRFFGETES